MKPIISIFLIFSLLSGVASANSMIRDAVTGVVVINQPIDLSMNIRGVKAESIYFGEKEALVILWNRTPKSMETHLGLALFDSEGQIMGTSIIRIENIFDLGGKIRSGKQKGFRLNYEQFINDIKNVSSYQLVFSVTSYAKKIEPSISDN